MNEDIMHLSNKLIYSDRLVCGSSDVANRSLVLPKMIPLDKLHGKVKEKCKDGECWMEKLLAER